MPQNSSITIALLSCIPRSFSQIEAAIVPKIKVKIITTRAIYQGAKTSSMQIGSAARDP